MGLDMYLVKKIYIGGNYDFNEVKGNIDISVKGKKIPLNLKKITYIEEDVAYWRKANHIHKWFVDNVQDGVDDCKNYYVSTEHLKELLKICKKVLKSCELTETENEHGEKTIKDYTIASELLPTKSGFCFGNTEYNEHYLDDIKYTIKIIQRALREEKKLNEQGIYNHFEYCSSW